MELIKSNFVKYKQFIIYSIIGVSGATLDFLTYALLTEVFDTNKLFANCLSTSIGIINNFILNVVFNFKVKDKLISRFISFYMVGLTGLALSTGIIFIFVEKLGWNNLLVKFLSIIFVVMLQYNLNKRVSFKSK